MLENKKISILVFDLSSNALVRTYPVAKTLSRKYSIEIIGVGLESQIYRPYKQEFKFKAIKRDSKRNILVSYFLLFKDILESIEGDIVYAFKPKLTSYIPALLAKIFYKIPVILDIEDLETVKWRQANFLSRIGMIFTRYDSNNEFLNVIIEKLIPFANEKIVVSSYLQSQFGGSRIIHGVNTRTFDPTSYDQYQERKKLKLDQDKFYILFSGMPREHKGIEDLLEAIKNINNDRIKLLLVGGDNGDKYVAHLKKTGSHFLVHTGPQPHNLMPSYLSAADIVVLPQRNTLFASAQIPAKVFEAMAMKKPIIATKVSDLEEILKNCAILIEPILNTYELENQIKHLFDEDEYGIALGKAAMNKSIECYSWEIMENQLYPLFDKYLR